MMDESDIKAARALCDAATGGEWTADVLSDGRTVVTADDVVGWVAECGANALPDAQDTANAAFIAAARTLLPAALDSLETTRRERDEALADGVLSQRVCDIENDLAQARSDLAATKAALAEAIALLEEAHYYRDDSKDFAAQVAALKAKVQP